MKKKHFTRKHRCILEGVNPVTDQANEKLTGFLEGDNWKLPLELAQAAYVEAQLQRTAHDQAMAVLEGDGPETTAEPQSRAHTRNKTRLTQQSREQLGQLKRWLGRESHLLGYADHTDAVMSVTVPPDSTKMLTGSHDGTARLWDVSSEKVPETLEELATRVRNVTFSPDGTKVLVGSFVGPTLMWEVVSGEPLAMWGKQVSGVTSAAFSPDGALVLTGSFEAVQLWDVVSGELLVTLRCERDMYIGKLASVAFSPTGTRIFASTKDDEDCRGSTHLWDWPSGKVLAELPCAWVTSVAFSPDGARVLTYSDRTMYLWDATSGKQLVSVDLAGRIITSMAFSPDGTQVLTGFTDGKIQLWETTTWRLLAMLKGHKSSVVSVTFSPSGRLIMTGDSSGLVLLRQAIGADMGKLLEAYRIAYKVGSIHWQDAIHVILAVTGGPLDRPPLYQLTLEETW